MMNGTVLTLLGINVYIVFCVCAYFTIVGEGVLNKPALYSSTVVNWDIKPFKVISTSHLGPFPMTRPRYFIKYVDITTAV